MDERPVALVTGASRGIGRGICVELARAGFRIAGMATGASPDSTGGLEETRRLVAEAGGEFQPVTADVSRIEAHEAVERAVKERFGGIDLLVNNAGVGPLVRRDVLETTTESFDRVLGVNLRGAFFLTQRIARAMVARSRRAGPGLPAIVFITSVSASFSSPNRAEYCISKAGLSQAAAVFADRLAGEGIAVYEVRPGLTATDMTAPVRRAYDRQIAAGLVPQGRWGESADVGRAVAALATGAFAYSTGLVVEVDGGLSLRRLHAVPENGGEA